MKAFILAILISMTKISIINCNYLNVNLPICKIDTNGKPLKYDNLCEFKKRNKPGIKVNTNATAYVGHWSVFSKMTHEVSGIGLECSKSKTEWTFYRTIFGDYYKSSETSFIQLNREECLNMRKTKICQIKENGELLKLDCNGDICSSIDKAVESWLIKSWWWGEENATTYDCEILPKFITAKQAKDFIFGTNCVPADLACHLKKSIIVWDKSIILECPFRPLILKELFQMVEAENGEHVLISYSNQTGLAMKIHKETTECGHHMLETTEGLYISNYESHFEKIASAKLEPTLSDEKSQMGLKLASDDYRQFKEIAAENELLLKECNLLKNSISLFSLHDDKFSTFTNLMGDEFILYTKNNQIYQTSCQQIGAIQIHNKTLKCYEDIPIKLNYTTSDGKSKRQIDGFLTLNSIIRITGKEIECNEKPIYMQIIKSNFTIKKLKNTYVVFNDTNNNELNVHLKKYETSLEHSSLLVNGVDYIDQISKINKVVEIDGSFNVINPILPTNDRKHFSLLQLISKIVTYALIILGCVFLTILGYFFIKLIICIKTKNKKKKEYNKVMETVKYVTQLKNSTKTNPVQEI